MGGVRELDARKTISFLIMITILTACIYYFIEVKAFSDFNDKSFLIDVSQVSWWNNSFPFRKNVTVESAIRNENHYAYRIVIHKSSGSDNDRDIYLNGFCQDDFDDIRFIDNDDITELNYTRYKYISGNRAEFYVRLSLTTTSSYLFYIYWGLAGISTTSNGENTFTYWEGFEGTYPWGWTYVSHGCTGGVSKSSVRYLEGGYSARSYQPNKGGPSDHHFYRTDYTVPTNYSRWGFSFNLDTKLNDGVEYVWGYAFHGALVYFPNSNLLFQINPTSQTGAKVFDEWLSFYVFVDVNADLVNATLYRQNWNTHIQVINGNAYPQSDKWEFQNDNFLFYTDEWWSDEYLRPEPKIINFGDIQHISFGPAPGPGSVGWIVGSLILIPASIFVLNVTFRRKRK